MAFSFPAENHRIEYLRICHISKMPACYLGCPIVPSCSIQFSTHPSGRRSRKAVPPVRRSQRCRCSSPFAATGTARGVQPCDLAPPKPPGVSFSGVPAVIPVSSLADSGPGTLRAAIAQADQDTTPDTITFESGLTGTITLLTALPDLSNAITLDGPGASALTVASSPPTGTSTFRIFTVDSGADVSLSGLTISGGDAGTGGGHLERGDDENRRRVNRWKRCRPWRRHLERGSDGDHRHNGRRQRSLCVSSDRRLWRRDREALRHDDDHRLHHLKQSRRRKRGEQSWDRRGGSRRRDRE